MNINKKEAYKNIYKIAYIANVNNVIDEHRYVNILQRLSTNGFKIYHIENFKELIQYLHKIGLHESFNISMLICMRDKIYKKIADVAIVFNEIHKIFANKKYKMLNRINKIQQLLKNKCKMIKSFKHIDLNMSINHNNANDILFKVLSSESTDNAVSTIIYDDSKYCSLDTDVKTQKIINEQYVREDIMIRLHLLAQTHFTIDQLKYMNVELRYVSEINDMKFNELCDYYTRVIGHIQTSIKVLQDMCREYVKIEINYIECCENMIKCKPSILTINISESNY